MYGIESYSEKIFTIRVFEIEFYEKAFGIDLL